MFIKKSYLALALISAMSLSAVYSAASFAQDSEAAAESSAQSSEAAPAQASYDNESFFKKKYNIKGTWSITERDGKQYVSFSDDFKTKNGPDLKIFLSPLSPEAVNGKNAIDGALNLGELTKNKGAQDYEIPEGTDLSQYSTVLVHCEKYEVLWGGGAL